MFASLLTWNLYLFCPLFPPLSTILLTILIYILLQMLQVERDVDINSSSLKNSLNIFLPVSFQGTITKRGNTS